MSISQRSENKTLYRRVVGLSAARSEFKVVSMFILIHKLGLLTLWKQGRRTSSRVGSRTGIIVTYQIVW